MISTNLSKDFEEMPSKQGSFYEVETSLQKYIEMATTAFQDEMTSPVENNYFVSTAHAIENLWKECHSSPMELLPKIKENTYLVHWFSMIVSMILFSADTLTQVTLPAEEAGIYTNVWKKTISRIGGNAKNETGLNVYAFSENLPSDIAGCCSDKYFVIPPKSYPQEDVSPEWKSFYFSLCDLPQNIDETLRKRSVIERSLLFLSANSMPDISKSPLGIIKNVVLEMNLVTQEQINVLRSVSLFGRKEGEITFFQVTSNEIPNELFTNLICVTKTDGAYHALYPISEKIVEKIENGECIIKKLKMEVKESPDNNLWLENVTVSAEFSFPLMFVRKNAVGEVTEEQCFLPVSEKISYGEEQIFNIQRMPTFCMYPNVALEFENRCKSYTYFSVTNCFIKSEIVGNLPVPDAVKIEHIFSGRSVARKNILGNMFYCTVEKPQHLIKTRSNQLGYLGCIFNLRISKVEFPALLPQSEILDWLDLSKRTEVAENKLYVYVDFGDSESMIGYKTETGNLQYGSLSRETPVIRKLLAGFFVDEYQKFLNLKEDVSEMDTVSSVSIRYDTSIEDIVPYHQSWQPSRYFEISPKVIPEDSDKEKLLLTTASGINANTATIIYNLCYTAICHAIDSNSSEVFIFPMYSSKRQYENLCHIWNHAVEIFAEMFSVKVHCLLNAENHELLLESLVASSHQFGKLINNLLVVDVNIGNAITEMSAVFIDKQGKRSLCAHASIPFGGKNLLKASVKNMLVHTPEVKNRKAFISHLLHENVVFLNHRGREEDSKLKKMTAGALKNVAEASMNSHSSGWLHYLDIPMRLSMQDLDIKFQADLYLRYGALIPVVKDFIRTAMRMCSYDEESRITVYFSGTASKLLPCERVRDYFAHFDIDCLPEITSTEKSEVMENLGKISCRLTKEGKFSLSGMDIEFPDTDVIDTDAFHRVVGSSREVGCRAFDFKDAHTIDTDSGNFYDYNMKSFRNPKNSMPDPSKLWHDVRKNYFRLMRVFAKESSIKGLMETILGGNFPDLWAIYQDDLFPPAEKISNFSSFGRACNAEIYPEMLRNTVYLFFTERFLSQNFGAGFSGMPVLMNKVDEKSEEYQDYKFSSDSKGHNS